mgnify:FL=1
MNRAQLLRQKLRAKKAEEEKNKPPEQQPEEKPDEEKFKPKSVVIPSALKPSALKPSALKPSALNNRNSDSDSNSGSDSDSPKKEQEKEEEKEEKKVDPLDFFNTKQEEKEPSEHNEELNELLDLIEGDDKKKENEKKKEESDDSNSESNSSSDSDEDNNAEQRLLRQQAAQAKLFANKNNRVSPVNDIFKPKKISEEVTKEQIIEKFGADFDKAVELPEINEQKKQIMLKKMRKTINKMSSQRIQKHMDAELRHIIEEKIDDLKKIKGANYNKIENKVQELILSLKQPDFYFADDEDVTQISDVQEKMDIKPRTDIDFEFFMKQTPKTN